MINKHKLYSLTLISAAVILILTSIAGAAPFAYVANAGDNTVTVIDTATNTVTATVPVGSVPCGDAVTPDGSSVYVTNSGSNTVSVIDTTTNTVTATVPVGSSPIGVAVTPDGTKVYVANSEDGTVSVIDTATNTVVGGFLVGSTPLAIAITPQKIPTLTWNPSPTYITYGTPLVAGQLNAQSSVSGTFAYKDGSTPVNIGTILSAGTHTLTATFTSTDPKYVSGGTVTATITVNGATPTLTWNPSPTSIIYGTPLVAGQLNAQSSASGTFAYTEGSTPVDTTTVLNAGTHTLTATFTSTDPNYASGETVTATITVNKATPTITWNNPANILYGIPLSSTQLDATSSVPGTFVYTPPPGTILSAGLHQTLSVTFTPTDTADYNTATAIVSINVINPGLEITKKASPLTYDYIGQIITYTYTVKNVGDVDIKGPIMVADDKFGTITIPNSDTLSKGSSVTGPAVTYQITDKDIDRRSVTNLATATGLLGTK